MSLPIEEVDKEGRAVFFKSPADISKSSEQDAFNLSSCDRVNDLYVDMYLPVPKFKGFVYAYSNYLTICSCTNLGGLKVKQKIEYDSIIATYPCEKDPTIVFLVVIDLKGRKTVRLLKFRSSIKGTNFRYVIDQLQMAPVQEAGYYRHESIRTTNNSGSSWSTPLADQSDSSTTSALHYFNRTAAHNPTMRAFYAKEEEPKIPRAQPSAFTSNLYGTGRSSRRSGVLDSFDAIEYEVYRPFSRKSRYSRYDYPESSRRSSSRRRQSKSRYESTGKNYNSRAAVRSKNLLYLDTQNNDYRIQHRTPGRSTSRNGSSVRRLPYYY